MSRIRGNSYLSRPVGTNQPPRFQRPRLIVAKEVSIGNQPATTRLHHAVAADKWLTVEELYDNRKRR